MIFPCSNRLKKATKEQEDTVREQMQEEKVGWKDGLAMVIAAFLTIVLPCLLLLLIVCGVAFHIFT